MSISPDKNRNSIRPLYPIVQRICAILREILENFWGIDMLSATLSEKTATCTLPYPLMVPEAGRAEEAQRTAGLKKVPLKIRHLVLMTDTVPWPRRRAGC